MRLENQSSPIFFLPTFVPLLDCFLFLPSDTNDTLVIPETVRQNFTSKAFPTLFSGSPIRAHAPSVCLNDLSLLLRAMGSTHVEASTESLCDKFYLEVRWQMTIVSWFERSRFQELLLRNVSLVSTSLSSLFFLFSSLLQATFQSTQCSETPTTTPTPTLPSTTLPETPSTLKDTVEFLLLFPCPLLPCCTLFLGRHRLTRSRRRAV